MIQIQNSFIKKFCSVYNYLLIG